MGRMRETTSTISASVKPPGSPRTLIVYLGLALVILGVVALQSYHFSRLNYRDDEIRTVHAGMTLSVPEVIRWMSVDIHPPFWRILATTWVGAFGPDEAVTRFLSTLLTAVSLALLFRIVRDLFDAQVALIAVFLLGTHALFLFYSHELRPYAALILWTNALHLIYLRWLRRPSFRLALIYVLVGAAALYTHYFALYIFLAQLVALAVLVRWNLAFYARTLGMFALAALSFAAWLPSFLHSFLVTKSGGIDYGIVLDARLPVTLYTLLQFRPLALGNFLQGAALVTALVTSWRPDEPAGQPFRFGLAWRVWYFVVIAVAVLGGAVVTNRWVDVLTQRNLLLIVPPLAVVAAVGVRLLPWQGRVLALALILLPALTEFVVYEEYEPYREVAAFVEPRYEARSPIILSVDNGTGAYFAFAYYLMDRLPGELTQNEMMYLTLGEARVNLPEPPLHIVREASPDALAAFDALIADAEQVFWITSDLEPPHAQAFRDRLEATFTRSDSVTLENRDTFDRVYRVDYYRRTNL